MRSTVNNQSHLPLTLNNHKVLNYRVNTKPHFMVASRPKGLVEVSGYPHTGHRKATEVN